MANHLWPLWPQRMLKVASHSQRASSTRYRSHMLNLRHLAQLTTALGNLLHNEDSRYNSDHLGPMARVVIGGPILSLKHLDA